MKSLTVRHILALACGTFLAGAATLTGCTTDDNRTHDATLGLTDFSVNSSADEVMVGETVTFTTRSTNLAGRNSEIEWSTTGGKLDTEFNNRVARVQFDRPGMYMISSTLLIEGEPVETDMIMVKVKPLHGR
ncbi:MAG: hypothetical protein L0Y44_10675 [Phycisphaerales bacterium]|nr:hypothetical protein [Phycisphaerales bacterium]MCI0631102.1 hypothetical protein [Phycisphaerales bacterium]MCI0675440.1 hypothetical protein [Phycisphaerales bacterium]